MAVELVELNYIAVEQMERVRQYFNFTFIWYTLDAGQCHGYVAAPVQLYKHLHFKAFCRQPVGRYKEVKFD